MGDDLYIMYGYIYLKVYKSCCNQIFCLYLKLIILTLEHAQCRKYDLYKLRNMNTMNWPNIKEIRNGKYVNEEIYRCLQNLPCPKNNILSY